MHLFNQAELDADLICFIEDELAPFGIIPSAKDFGATLFAVLASTFPLPRNQQSIWRHFCLNTLAKLRDQIAHPPLITPIVSYITPFAAIYRRIFELCIGQSFLDVGCSFGFLPVLLAEHAPDAHITGCDNNPDALRFSTDLAAMTGVCQATFSLQDILDPTILCLGTFDTVTVLHVLEHLPEQEMSVALTHLLRLTTKRLIIAVPYEERAQVLYGHQQVFTPEKLHAWGRWCIDMLEGAGQYWCEDVMGGMLIIERSERSEQQ
jgi:SAM-dependent methyltransferase